MVSTRAKNYIFGEDPRESRDPSSIRKDLIEQRRRWAHLLRENHYQPLISEVLENEMPKYNNSTVIDVSNRVSHMRDCALILASAPSVFAAAVDGTLVSQMRSDTNLEKQYTDILERAHHQPSIYAHFLTDKYGKSPSANQYLTVRDMVSDYLVQGEASEHAWQLDNISHPFVTKQASAQGHRKYLHTSQRSAKRVEAFYRFCHGIQTRWLETPASLRDTPFEYPPAECGYSKDSHVRLAQHRAHQSSNHVMNLVEDVCTHLHRTGIFEHHFTMHQFIIYLIFQQSQAAIAEIFCSGLLQVWVENGGGFNAYPAGLSVESSRRVSGDQWTLHERHARLESFLVDNMRLQQQRADEWRKALEWDGGAVAAKETADKDEDDCIDTPIILQEPVVTFISTTRTALTYLTARTNTKPTDTPLPRNDITNTTPLYQQHTMASSHPNSSNGNGKENDNVTISSETARRHQVELADLGRDRFDQDVAAIGDRDYALTVHRPIVAPTGRAPRGMESAVHAWTTFQYTTEEVNAREELKGDLHGGQLHRENRAARDPQAVMAQMARGGGGGGGGRGGGRGGRGGRNGGREQVDDDGFWAARKPDYEGPPVAKGMAEEMDKSMFWESEILKESEMDLRARRSHWGPPGGC
ncbi:1114670KZM18619.1 methyltransferase [Pyrenophora seminiperda CCB06]|uniref:1114670KZM18619.1 methyltransferase n=1 Tax=Pyrenophora seminiperda CCB06 TaxID=1302712 RepID=A0A3M7M6P6_9PLEO|nr:1114670KZM18619.1 methyltransferase [Pyrenophora seminiperda CCB06]